MPTNKTAHHQTAFSARNDKPSGGVVLKKLSPAAPGAKRLASRYGAALLCVRYREDIAGQRRLTTVELVIDERPLPRPPGVRVAYEETELRRQVKAASGIWDGIHKLWRLPKAAIRKLKLEHRIISENA